jgi:hypothetical protein
MLQAREHAPTPSPSIVSIFGLAVESIRNLGVHHLVWDPKKRFEAMGARHSFHPAYLTHIGISFPSI